MALDRQEKEELVRDLYFNKRKSYREIAREARVSLRDIKGFLNEGAQGTADSPWELPKSKAAQAYEMFQGGKTPMDVAIALDLREPEVTQLYRESWNLKQTAELNRVYLETGGNLGPILNLYKSSSAAGYNTSHVVWLLGVADKGLPEITKRYNDLKSAVDSLEAEKLSLIRLNQDYRAQTKALGRSFDNYCLQCEQEEKRLSDLRSKRMKEEALVRQFENNNREYVKITRTIEEKVRATLTNRKKLLELAALSIVESIRKHPEKYSSLIPYETLTDFTSPDFNPYYSMFGLRWPQQQIRSNAYLAEDFVAMLSEDADKIMEKLVKEMKDEILSEYPGSTSLKPSIPALPASD